MPRTGRETTCIYMVHFVYKTVREIEVQRRGDGNCSSKDTYMEGGLVCEGYYEVVLCRFPNDNKLYDGLKEPGK